MSVIKYMTNVQGLVSVIMAAYNAEKTIRASIKSVLAQTYQNWELLVVDDGSKDNTAKIVESFEDPRIHLFRNEENKGVSISRKIGADNSKGEWIAILDSDDIWVNNKLEKQIKLAKEVNGELIFTGSAFIRENGDNVDWKLHVPETLCYKELLKQNLVSNSSSLVKSELYKKHYAISDKMHEDFAIWLNITKEGKLAYGIDEPLLIYRLSSSSKSGNKFKAAIMNWNTYRYIGLNPIVALYYMCWYMIKGILKYRHLK